MFSIYSGVGLGGIRPGEEIFWIGSEWGWRMMEWIFGAGMYILSVTGGGEAEGMGMKKQMVGGGGWRIDCKWEEVGSDRENRGFLGRTGWEGNWEGLGLLVYVAEDGEGFEVWAGGVGWGCETGKKMEGRGRRME